MTCSLVWLRDDLRVADNPALVAAVDRGEPVVVVFILDEVSPGIRPLGGATKWWLHHSLAALSDKISRLGGQLILRQGAAPDIMRGLIRETAATALYWNRRYGKPERDMDAAIKDYAKASGIEATSFQANLLFEPWTVRTGNDTPYTVFTPFWKSCLNRPTPPRLPAPTPESITSPASLPESDELESWNLLPTNPDWALAFPVRWTVEKTVHTQPSSASSPPALTAMPRGETSHPNTPPASFHPTSVGAKSVPSRFGMPQMNTAARQGTLRSCKPMRPSS